MPLIQNLKDDVSLQFEARKNDLERITKWLASPAGLKFVGKQALLRTSANTNITDRASLLNGAGAGVADAASAIAAILAQVPLAGTGTHFLFNELSAIAFQDNTSYAGNRNAANEANYQGVVTIKKTKKMRGAKTYEEQGLAPTGQSDEIGKLGILHSTDKKEDINAAIKKDALPISFSIVGEPNSTLIFRGFIQGLSDNFSANWNAYNYVGRAEPLYTYTGASRGIGYTMMIPIFSAAEQEPTYKKLNSLLSYAYPKYVNDLPQGTVARMKLGDYITCYGVINSMTVTVANDVPWSTPDDTQRLLPQVINLNLNLNVIHERMPERYTEGTPYFIGNKALTPRPAVTTDNVIERGIVPNG